MRPQNWERAVAQPAFALTRQSVSNYTLGLRDIREMPETNYRFSFCAGGLHQNRKRSDNRYQCFSLHSFVSIGECHHEISELSIVAHGRAALRYELALIRSN